MKGAILVRCCLGLMFVVGLNGCSDSPPVKTDALVLGDPFPALVIRDFDSNDVDLQTYKGKLIVLNLWATWCEPCRREMPALQALSDALDPERFAVIGVSVDEDEHVAREYLIDKDIQFPNFWDAEAEQATSMLGAQLFPYTFLISPEGEFIQRVPGAREWHRQEVVDLLNKLARGDVLPPMK